MEQDAGSLSGTLCFREVFLQWRGSLDSSDVRIEKVIYRYPDLPKMWQSKEMPKLAVQ
jgi:hypothetical protein